MNKPKDRLIEGILSGVVVLAALAWTGMIVYRTFVA